MNYDALPNDTERVATQIVDAAFKVHATLGPELNPVERIWLYLRERVLSLPLLHDTEAIVEACCIAWNQILAEPGKIKSPCDFPWIAEISS